MADFSVRSDAVDVEQIMKQIRGRIAEKRGVDYTEEQIRELASVRLAKFLDPKNLRSDLLEQFRRSRPAVSVDPASFEPPYTFDDQTLFTSHRGPLRLIRRLLFPILKLFFNPNTLNQVLHTQSKFNVELLKRDAARRVERAEWNALSTRCSTTGARDDADDHRGQEPPHAGRVAVEPPRLQRASGPRARGRGPAGPRRCAPARTSRAAARGGRRGRHRGGRRRGLAEDGEVRPTVTPRPVAAAAPPRPSWWPRWPMRAAGAADQRRPPTATRRRLPDASDTPDDAGSDAGPSSTPDEQ